VVPHRSRRDALPDEINMSKHIREQTLKAERALDHMRRGSRLVHMHGMAKTGFSWFVVPGGPITGVVARKLLEHPNVVGGKDGLFPGHDQTWRMTAFA
jgi:hypothetical protein